MKEALVEQYRPARFSDVVGQTEAVRFLSSAARKGMRKSLLLFGAVGSGKTTIARLYGKALFCENRGPDGSACNSCVQCKKFAEGRCAFHEFDCPRAMESELDAKVGYLLKSPPDWDDLRFFFFDEAHALSAAFLDKLLISIEGLRNRWVFCLATTEPDRIAPAIKSRLFTFEIRSLSTTAAVSFLKDVTSRSGLQADGEALLALAIFTRGQIRDLLQRLDQLEAEPITLEAVERNFGLGDADHLASYLAFFADGDSASALRAFLAWPAVTERKVRLILSFLTSVYFQEVEKLDLYIEAEICCIPGFKRQHIVRGLQSLAALANSDFASFSHSLMTAWPSNFASMNEAALLMHLARFHEAMSGSARRRPNKQNPLAPQKKRGRRGKVKITQPTCDPTYLSYAEARDIINRAAFCVQHYGRQFNARITLRHALFRDGKKAAKRLSDFLHAWREWMRANAPEMPLLRLAVQEIDEDGSPIARVIAHFPPGKGANAETWCRLWGKVAHANTDASQPIEIEYRKFASTASKRSSSWHRELVLWLCGGMDPNIKVTVGADHEAASLSTLLGIRHSRKAGYIGRARRIMASVHLLPSSMEESSRLKMPIISPFDAARFDQIGKSWELDEHVARTVEFQKRLEQLKYARSVGDGDVPIAGWGDDPLARPRTYQGWWIDT